MNLYAYCANNPVGYCDHSGYVKCESKGNSFDAADEANINRRQALNKAKDSAGIPSIE